MVVKEKRVQASKSSLDGSNSSCNSLTEAAVSRPAHREK